MALDLSAVRKKTLSAVAKFHGEEINLKYRPAVITPAWSSGAAKMDQDNPKVVDILISQVIELVAEWDLEDSSLEGEDKIVPLDKEHLLYIPIEILGACIEGVMGANVASDTDEGKKGK